jgi:hypothetical protein
MQCCGSGMFIPDPNFLPKNLSLSSKVYGFGIRDPESGINLFRIPDLGPGIKKDTGFRIPNPDPQHWSYDSAPLPQPLPPSLVSQQVVSFSQSSCVVAGPAY